MPKMRLSPSQREANFRQGERRPDRTINPHRDPSEIIHSAPYIMSRSVTKSDRLPPRTRQRLHTLCKQPTNHNKLSRPLLQSLQTSDDYGCALKSGPSQLRVHAMHCSLDATSHSLPSAACTTFSSADSIGVNGSSCHLTDGGKNTVEEMREEACTLCVCFTCRSTKEEAPSA